MNLIQNAVAFSVLFTGGRKQINWKLSCGGYALKTNNNITIPAVIWLEKSHGGIYPRIPSSS